MKEERERIEMAKKLCAECPVRTDCLEFSVATASEGIWGGLDTRERLGKRA